MYMTLDLTSLVFHCIVLCVPYMVFPSVSYMLHLRVFVFWICFRVVSVLLQFCVPMLFWVLFCCFLFCSALLFLNRCLWLILAISLFLCCFILCVRSVLFSIMFCRMFQSVFHDLIGSSSCCLQADGPRCLLFPVFLCITMQLFCHLCFVSCSLYRFYRVFCLCGPPCLKFVCRFCLCCLYSNGAGSVFSVVYYCFLFLIFPSFVCFDYSFFLCCFSSHFIFLFSLCSGRRRPPCLSFVWGPFPSFFIFGVVLLWLQWGARRLFQFLLWLPVVPLIVLCVVGVGFCFVSFSCFLLLGILAENGTDGRATMCENGTLKHGRFICSSLCSGSSTQGGPCVRPPFPETPGKNCETGNKTIRQTRINRRNKLTRNMKETKKKQKSVSSMCSLFLLSTCRDSRRAQLAKYISVDGESMFTSKINNPASRGQTIGKGEFRKMLFWSECRFSFGFACHLFDVYFFSGMFPGHVREKKDRCTSAMRDEIIRFRTSFEFSSRFTISQWTHDSNYAQDHGTGIHLFSACFWF